MLNRLNQTDLEFAGAAPKSFDIREAINFAWRQWKLILSATVLAALVGAIYIARQTPLYTASAQLLLDPKREKAAGADSIYTDSALDLPAIESQMAIIRSSALLRRVVAKERLVNDSEFGVGPVGAGGSIFGSIKSFFTRDTPAAEVQRSSASASELDNASPETIATIENLKGAVGVTRAGQAYVIAVTMTSADAGKAAKLANAVADAYVVDKLDARFDATRRASAWLSDRLVELRQQLRESEQAVAQFRSDNNLLQSSPSATLNQDQLAQLNSRLVTARSEAAEKKARLDLLSRVQASGGNIGSLPDVMNSGAIADLRKQESELSRQEADLLARYSDRHPSVVNIRAQISDIRRSMQSELKRQTGNISNEYELAKARQDAVERTLREVTGATDLDQSKAITLRELERTATVNKSLFEDFLQRSRVTQEQSTFEARDARVITPALAPGFPTSPKKGQIMLISLFLGLLAGVGGAYLLEKLNAGFTTPHEVEELLDLPVLASISRMESRDLSADGVALTMPEYPFAKPLSRFSEAIRSLRSAIKMSDVDNPPTVLQVTSTIPGEGKSTIAMTIATSAAQSDLRVMIIDADLRHPSTSRYFKLDQKPGVVEYLAETTELKNVVYFDEARRVWVLPAGGKTQNPPDLLGSERFKQMIAACKTQFDLVVIDTPPMGPVVDPLIVSTLVDKVVFVVKWASTARDMIAHSVERLGGHKMVAGVIFNHVVDAQAQKYGKYAYSYYYSGRYYKKYYTE